MIQKLRQLISIKSIYSKLFFLFSVIGVIPLIIGSFYIYSNSRQALLNMSLKEQELDVNNAMRNAVILFVESNDNLLLTSQNASFIRYFAEPDEQGIYKQEQEDALVRLSTLSPLLTESAGFADIKGNLISYVFKGSVISSKDVNISDRTFFNLLINARNSNIYTGLPEFSQISKRWVIPIATHIYSRDKRPLGILFMQIYLDNITKLIKNIVHPASTVFVIDHEGHLIAHSDKPIDQAVSSAIEPTSHKSYQDVLKKMMAGDGGNSRIIYNDMPSFITYKDVPKGPGNLNKWSIGVITQEDKIYEGVSSQKYIIIVLSMSLLLFAAAGIIGWRIARPIHKLTLTSLAMSKGDLTSRVNIERNDEIGQLANAFNEMASSMQTSHEELIKLSSTDGLTGLYNHREFQKRLESEIERAHRYSYNLSLLMIDIDNFKKFNDTYGHQTGDEVLQSISRIIQKEIRRSDFAARYGGEEISIILPESDSENAFLFSDRLRKHINQIPITVMVNRSVHVSISIGIASYPENASDRRGLIEAADQALYFAKDSGKNKAALYRDTLKAALEQKSLKPQTLLEQAEEWIFKGIYTAIEAKIPFHRGQLHSMSNVTVQIAEYMYLNDEETRDLKIATMLHDVGIFNVPFQILQKPAPLTEEEWKMVKSHPEMGVNLLNNVLKIRHVLPAILHHHERYDGSGYPHGLKGEEIPLFSRIIAVVDAYFSMTSISPYREKFTQEEAIAEMEHNSGTQFDPHILSIFIEILKKEVREINNKDKSFFKEA